MRRSSPRGLPLLPLLFASLASCGPQPPPAPRAANAPAIPTASATPSASAPPLAPAVVTPGKPSTTASVPVNARLLVQRAASGGLGADVSVSRDGFVATWTDDEMLRIWHLASRSLVRVVPKGALGGFVDPARPVWDEATHEVLLAGGGGAIVAVDTAGRVRQRKWETEAVGLVPAPTPTPTGGAMRWVARTYQGFRWVDAEGKATAELAAPSLGEDMAVSRDGKFALGASEKGLVRFALGPAGGAPKTVPIPKTPLGKEDAVAWRTLALSSDGETALACANAGTRAKPDLRLFRVASLSRTPLVTEVPIGAGAIQCSVVVAGASDVAIVGTAEGLLGVRVSTGAVLWRTPRTQIVTGIAASDDGRSVAVVGYDGVTTVYDTRAGDVMAELGVSVTVPQELAFQRDESLVATKVMPSMFGSLQHVAAWSLKDGTRTQSVDVDWGTYHRLAEDGAMHVARVALLAGEKPCAPTERGVTFSLATIGAGAPKVVGEKGAWPPSATRGATACLPSKRSIVDVEPASGRMVVSSRESGPKETYAVVDAKGASHTLADVPSGGLGGTTLWFSRAGSWVFSAPPVRGGLSTLHVWSAASGAKIGTFTAHPKDSEKAAIVIGGGEKRRGYWAEAVSDDGAALAVGSDDSVTIYELPGKRVVRTVALGDVGYVTSVAFAAGSRTRVLVGMSDGTLHASDESGALRSGASTGGALHTLVARRDGRRVATLSDDGGVRIWDGPTVEPLATLIEFADGESIVSTPRGAYTGTWEAADRIRWVFDAPAEGFSFQQFAKVFQRPDVVAKRLAEGGPDVEQAVRRPPRVALATPPPARVKGASSVTLTAHVSSPEGAKVSSLVAFVEGRPVRTVEVGASDADVKLEIPLLPGLDVVSLVAFDDGGASSNPTTFEVVSEAATTAARPDLWIVSAGVGRYPNMAPAQQLDATANDARSIAAAFGAQAGAGKPFAAAHTTVLLDDQVTPASLEGAVRGLSAMKPDDVAIVFFAGHGVKLPQTGEMVLATSGAALTAASVASNGVGWKAMGAALATAKGRVVVLLDACHSGAISQELVVPNSTLADDLVKSQRAGVVVFAASKGRELSYEASTSRGLVLDAAQQELVVAKSDPAPPPKAGPSAGHGFFTGALLRSLEAPSTDANRNGVIELSELVAQVTVRVGRVSGGKQNPWVARRELFGDFGLARAR